jgi:phage terminase large subunit-like protein
MELPPDDDDEALERYLATLTPKAKAEVAKRVRARLDVERKVWFCDRGRSCNGKPHGVYNYRHARGDQHPPPGANWLVWLLRGGRGSGKTRTGSEYTRYISKKIPSLALIGPTGPAVRNVMIEGPDSGLIKACENAGESYLYEPSKSRFTFESGARAQLFSAEEPDRVRGANFGFLWGDEPAHWDDPQTVWDLALLALRVGRRPHVLATTTPLPSEFMKTLIADPDTVSIGVSTYENIDNLAEKVVRQILKRYEGTYLGRQEIHGEIIDDREGALWSSEQFNETDFYFEMDDVAFDRVVVGIDPAGSQNKRSDLTGIVVGGKRGDVLFAIDDLSGKYSPSGWAQKAIGAYETYKADAIVVERNYGGDMCRATLKAEEFTGRIIEARATDGKRVRAEPISAKYEQGTVRHRRGGKVAKLESEMVSWIPGEGKSPNRIDAWVWCATSLTRGGGKAAFGDPTKGAIGRQEYRGPGSAWAKKRYQRGVR